MNTNRIVAGLGLGALVLLALGAVFGSFYTVDQGDRAVLLRNGAVVGVEQPGLHSSCLGSRPSIRLTCRHGRSATARSIPTRKISNLPTLRLA